jgi:hypothetical protein
MVLKLSATLLMDFCMRASCGTNRPPPAAAGTNSQDSNGNTWVAKHCKAVSTWMRASASTQLHWQVLHMHA